MRHYSLLVLLHSLVVRHSVDLRHILFGLPICPFDICCKFLHRLLLHLKPFNGLHTSLRQDAQWSDRHLQVTRVFRNLVKETFNLPLYRYGYCWTSK